MKVLGCMTVGRAVAAADMAAGPAEAQMHPRRTDLQTLLTAEGAWGDVTDACSMYAFVGHEPPNNRRRYGVAARFALDRREAPPHLH